jgi:hypothetical protein
MRSRSSRGQAALEFLIAYGWAIAGLIVAIGALTYFGILSPQRVLPDKCVTSPPFLCQEFKVNTTAIMLQIQNVAGEDMSDVVVDVTCQGGGIEQSQQIMAGRIVNNEDVVAVFGLSCGSASDRVMANFTLTYILQGEAVAHVATGTLRARVEE